jgi:HSP20 family protein
MPLPVRRRDSSGTSAATMAPGRWEPFRELAELQEATSHLMQSVLAGDGGPWTPPVDIEETEDAWIIEAEIPGASKEDLNVEVRDSEVAIAGEIKERERKGILRRRTRRVGEFEFRVTLPGPIDADALEARLDDGVLTVVVPKPQEARPHRVEVRHGGA